MEKFSKWRDAGTGIQPFLPPVPAGGRGGPQWAVYNAAASLSAVSRSAALLVVAVAYMVVVQLPKTLLVRSPALAWKITRLPTAAVARFALFLMGYWWIDTELVQVKRIRGAQQKVDVQPKQGDLVVCNWTGVVDVLYLAFRFNPTFLLPIHEPLPASSATGSGTATPTSNSNLPSISQSPQAKFLGYTPVSLLTILRNTGHTPSAFRSLVTTPKSDNVDLRKVFPSLESVRKVVPGPVVVFPEGTTSNGRALLRFADGVLGDVKSVPVRGYSVWVLFFKHPPPSSFSPTATHSTPPPSSSSGTGLNPLPHLFGGVLKTLIPRRMSVRTLHPHSAPSSGDFLPSETLGLSSSSSGSAKTRPLQSSSTGEDNVLAECCKTLLLQLGRVKSVGLGWEDKDGFLGFVRERRAGSAAQGRKKDK